MQNNSNEKTNSLIYVHVHNNERKTNRIHTASNDNYWITGSWLGTGTPSFLALIPIQVGVFSSKCCMKAGSIYRYLNIRQTYRTGYRNFGHTKPGTSYLRKRQNMHSWSILKFIHTFMCHSELSVNTQMYVFYKGPAVFHLSFDTLITKLYST
jgi:hypothetical protein